MSVELCEWDPSGDGPAMESADRTLRTGCPNEAMLLLARNGDDWHLCGECADLPRFIKWRVRKPLRAGVNRETDHG
jgi:hypothetical protein